MGKSHRMKGIWYEASMPDGSIQKTLGGISLVGEQLPGANAQGLTLEEARANLTEREEMVLDANRALAEEDLCGADVIREPLEIFV